MDTQISLELGGNAPCIIFDDANVEIAVKGAVSEDASQLCNSCQIFGA